MADDLEKECVPVDIDSAAPPRFPLPFSFPFEKDFHNDETVRVQNANTVSLKIQHLGDLGEREISAEVAEAVEAAVVDVELEEAAVVDADAEVRRIVPVF